MPQMPSIAIRIGERELIGLVLAIKGKGEAEHIVLLMLGRFVIKHLLVGQSLPPRPTRASHQGCETQAK